MNIAHFHLAMAHLPVVLIPLATLLLGIAWIKNNTSIRYTAYGILISAALIGTLVFLSGEPTEEFLEAIIAIPHQTIKAHEEAAEMAFASFLVTGVLAIGAVVFKKSPKIEKNIGFLVLVSAILSSFLLLMTANLGGHIRHTELSQSIQSQ
jgi:hypothetical protein